MNRIIFFRHGQSMGNHDKSFYKYPDSVVCLTTLGVQQCVEGAKTLKPLVSSLYYDPPIAYVSRFTRAKQTANIILDVLHLSKVKTIESNFLNERNCGNYHDVDGMHTDPYIAPQDGESMVDVRKRVGYFIDTVIMPQLTLSDIFLFGHAQLQKGLTAHLLKLSDMDMMKVAVPNATPTIFEYNGNEFVHKGPSRLFKRSTEIEVFN